MEMGLRLGACTGTLSYRAALAVILATVANSQSGCGHRGDDDDSPLCRATVGTGSISACEETPPPPPPPPPVPPTDPATPPEHIRFFGYYHWDRWYNGVRYDHTDTLIAMGNNNIGVLPREALARPDVVTWIRSSGFRLIVGIPGVTGWGNPFGSPACQGDGACGQGRMTLVAEFDRVWDDFKMEVQGLEDVIYAFYMDEPFWNGLRQADLDRMMNDYVKRDFPAVRRMVVEGGGMLDANRWPYHGHPVVTAEYLRHFTDVGFDDYGIACDSSTYAALMTTLGTLAPQASLWVVPKVFVSGNDFGGRTVGQALTNLDAYYDGCLRYAYDQPRVVGVFNYTFDARADTGDWDRQRTGDASFVIPGFRELSDPTSAWYDSALTQRHMGVGRQIVARSVPPRQATR